VLGGSGTPSYGGISLSGNGSFNLSAPTTGTYQGILILQPKANTRAMSISGNAATGITAGTIYAPAALLAMSGNGQLRSQVSLAVDRLQVSGNGSSALTTDGVGTGTGITAGELLAGDLFLYVDNPNGSFSADDLARLDETIASLDVLLATYNVTIAEVHDRSLANLVLDIGTTSAAGGYAEGVLGCFTNTGEITLIQGWNWYAGVDPAAIGAGQYDFQTIVTHELGHALGLGHSTDAGSVMYVTLDTGAVRRTMTVADLNLRDSGSGADALRAVPVQAIAAYAAMMPAPSGWGTEAEDTFSALPAATPSAARLTSETFGPFGSSRESLENRTVRVRDQFFQLLATEKDQAIDLDGWLSSVRVGKGEAETIGSLSRLLTNTLGHKELAEEAETGFLDEELFEVLAMTS
jgi:hypothetical protein